MDPKNIEKIRSLVGRPFKSLPLAEDLPRLLKHIRVLKEVDDDSSNANNTVVIDGVECKQLFPSEESFSLCDSLYSFLMVLSKHIVGSSQEDQIRETFDSYFRKESPSPLITPKDQQNNNTETKPKEIQKDGLESLQDIRLRDALRFLPFAYIGGTETPEATFLFKLDKPNSNVALFIGGSKKVQMKDVTTEGLQTVKIDCTISCASAILSAIVSGSLEAIVALKGQQLIVDNLEKLVVFGKLFNFDKKAFEQYKTQNGLNTTTVPFISLNQTPSNSPSLISSPNTSRNPHDDTVAVGLNIKKYFSEVLGEENKILSLLKSCNSATVSPAIIELKFALGVKYMTKDVPFTWKFDIVISSDASNVVVKSRKTEQELKSLFRYDWEVAMVFLNSNPSSMMTPLLFDQVHLHVLGLNFTDMATDDKKEEVKASLSKYATQPENLKTPTIDRLRRMSIREPNQAEQYPNGDQYEGEFNEEGLRHGKGVYTTPSGDVYVGSYSNGVKEGYGTYTMKDGTRYVGEFKNGVPNGNGVYVFENGDVYTGEFLDDEFHGEGNWSSLDGSHYQGQFFHGKRHGKGILFSRGSTYDGEWRNGIFWGHGVYVYANGDIYEGSFSGGKFNGYGRYTVSASGQIIEGQFSEGKPVNLAVEMKRQDPKEIEKQREKFEKWREDNMRKIDARKRILKSKQEIATTATNTTIKKNPSST